MFQLGLAFKTRAYRFNATTQHEMMRRFGSSTDLRRAHDVETNV